MHYAFVLSLCVAAASPSAPTAEIEMEAAARAFRIESYNRHREDRERYQQLRDADDELRLGLSAAKEADLEQRREEATAWYREATGAVHAGDEIPATPVWLPEALADAAAGKLRETKTSPASRSNAFAKTEKPAAPAPQTLPPALSEAKPASEGQTPFFFVDAAIRAVENMGTGSPQPVAPKFDVKEPVIDPPGPIVDELPTLPATELPTLDPTAHEPAALAPESTEAVPPVADAANELPIEPAMELPSLDDPAVELPSLPSLENEGDTK